MALIKPKKARVLKKKKEVDDGVLFETFMLEEGIWVKIDGQITEWNQGFLTIDQIKQRFSTWKNKFNQKYNVPRLETERSHLLHPVH